MLAIVLGALTAIAVVALAIGYWRDKASSQAKPQADSTTDGGGPTPLEVADQLSPEISALEFETMVTGDKALVVLFYTSWCPSCTRHLPHYLEIAREMSGSPDSSIQFRRMDLDKCRSLARRIDIQKIPTTAVFKGSSTPIASRSGVILPVSLRAMIRDAVESAS